MNKDFEWLAIVGALQTYKKLCHFMLTTIVEDRNKYVKEMDDFDRNVIKFYKHGTSMVRNPL